MSVSGLCAHREREAGRKVLSDSWGSGAVGSFLINVGTASRAKPSIFTHRDTEAGRSHASGHNHTVSNRSGPAEVGPSSALQCCFSNVHMDEVQLRVSC